MARKQQSKTSGSKSKVDRQPSRFGNWFASMRQRHGLAMAKLTFCVVMLAAILVSGAAAFRAMEKNVIAQRKAKGRICYQVKLENPPAWMPRQLQRRIAASLTPKLDFDDDGLCRDVYRRGDDNIWLAGIERVRRVRGAGKLQNYGVVKVKAVYRQPVAKVLYGSRTFFVDGDGYVLPYEEVPQWAAKVNGQMRYYISEDEIPLSVRGLRIHYILIEGVNSPPVGVGKPWQASDLLTGLRLVKLVSTRNYSNQISVVDVRNHKRRVSETEPELRMFAQHGNSRPTDIRFGRFPHPKGGDWVISPARKMQYLDDYVSDHGGRLAGVNSYIDVRNDELRLSLN